jgi:hypothetical protein
MLLACGSPPDAGDVDAAGAEDASGTDAVEADAVALDAPPPDAPPPDAPPPDANVGPAAVVVSELQPPDNVPGYAAGVPVVFYRPDGTVDTVVVTGADGRAAADIAPGSMVAIVYPSGWVDAVLMSPGDTVHFGPEVTSRTVVGVVVISWPPRVISGSTIYYNAITPCGRVETLATSASFTLYADCAAEPFDVVVTSRRSSYGSTGVMLQRDVAPGAVVTVDFAAAGTTWAIGTEETAELINTPNAGAPGASSSCRGSQFLETMHIGDLNGGISGDGECLARVLPVVDSTMIFSARFLRDNDSRFDLRMSRPFPHDALAPFDASDSLPWITSVAYDAGTRELTWTSEQSATFDVSRVSLIRHSQYYRWRLFAPHGLPPSFRIPPLPPQYAASDLPADLTDLIVENIDVVGASVSDLAARGFEHEHPAFAHHVVRSARGSVDY